MCLCIVGTNNTSCPEQSDSMIEKSKTCDSTQIFPINHNFSNDRYEIVSPEDPIDLIEKCAKSNTCAPCLLSITDV